MIRPVGQAVKTPPFHGGNSSSILLRVTKNKKRENIVLSFLFFLIRPLTRIQVNGAKRKPCLYRFPKTDADLIDNFPPFTVEQRRCLCSVRSSATGHQDKKENAMRSLFCFHELLSDKNSAIDAKETFFCVILLNIFHKK